MDLKSNEPFWLIKNGLMHSYPSLQEDLTCDILIVGGGITGSLLAHQCVKEGYNTVLIDKREIGNGSSSATTSMLQYEIDIPLYSLTEMIGKTGAEECYHACSAAIDQLQVIAKEIQSEAGFKKKKSIYFASTKKDARWLQKEYEARREAGFQVAWHTAEEVERKFDISNNHGAIVSKQGASVDAFHLLHEILQYNTDKGLQVFDKTTLERVVNKNSKNICTLSTGHTITAKKIIYCVGYESKNMISEKFVDLISTFAIISEVDPQLEKTYHKYLVWNTADPYIYMRSTADGRVLIGGEDEEFQNPQKRDDLIEKKKAKLLKSFQKINATIPFRPDFAWAGTFGVTKDGLPYIGTHPKFPDSYFVLGFGGNGITFSVTGMEMASAWLKGKKHKLSPYFAFGR